VTSIGNAAEGIEKKRSKQLRITILGKTRFVLLYFDSSKRCVCPLYKFLYAFKVVKLFLKHPVLEYYWFYRIGRTGHEPYMIQHRKNMDDFIRKTKGMRTLWKKQGGRENRLCHSQVTDSRRAVLQKAMNNRLPQNEIIFLTSSELARFSKSAKLLGANVLHR
jgi:hypothetical protein